MFTMEYNRFVILLLILYLNRTFATDIYNGFEESQPSDETILQVYPCKTDLDWSPAIKVVSASLKPGIPVIPGSVSVSLVVDVLAGNVPNDLNAESVVKLMLPIGGMIQIGCLGSDRQGCGGIGSCKFCHLLGDCYQPDGDVFHSIPCQPTVGRYRVVVQRTIEDLPLAAHLLGTDTLAMFEIELRVVDAVLNTTLGCGVVYVFSKFQI